MSNDTLIDCVADAIWKSLDPRDEIGGVGIIPNRFNIAAQAAITAMGVPLPKDEGCAATSSTNHIAGAGKMVSDTLIDCVWCGKGQYHHPSCPKARSKDDQLTIRVAEAIMAVDISGHEYSDRDYKALIAIANAALKAIRGFTSD